MAMIFCNECGREISDRATNCPNCGCPLPKNSAIQAQEQRPKEGKISGLSITALILSVLGCTFIIGVILAIIDLCMKDGRKKTCSIIALAVSGVWLILSIGLAGRDEAPSSDVKNVTSEQESNEDSGNHDLDMAEESNKETEFSIGEIAEYKDLRVSVIGYEESKGNDWGTPSDGNIFVFPEIEISNGSDEEISVSSMISFECYVDDYKTDFSSNAFMAISVDDKKQQLDGSVAPGKRLKGILGIEAPENWRVIEIYYKENVWLDSNFSFRIEK